MEFCALRACVRACVHACVCVCERERETWSHHSGVYSPSELILTAACVQTHTSFITVSITQLCSHLGLNWWTLLTVFTLILKAGLWKEELHFRCLLWCSANHTDCSIFHQLALDDATDTISDYINFCVDNVVEKKDVVLYPNNKPYITKDIKKCINNKKLAFRNKDKVFNAKTVSGTKGIKI